MFSPELVNFRAVFEKEQSAGLAGYSTEYGQDLIHSLILLGTSVAVALVLGTPAGYALPGLNSPVAVSWGGAHLVYIAPALVYVLPLYVVYEKLDLLGSFVALILFYRTFELPFVTFMMRGCFSDIPA